MENFNHIYQQHYPAIFRLVFGFVGKKDIAADLTQEVFIKLFTHLQAGAKLDFPKTWLYKVATNECLNFFTRNKTIYPLDEAITIECNKSDIAENQIVKNETQQLLQSAILRLKPKEKILLTLYSENFSYKEISEITGIKPASVGKSIAQFKNLIEGYRDSKNYPAKLPCFSEMLIDSDNNILLFRFTRQEGSNRFDVYTYDNTGKKIATSSFAAEESYDLKINPAVFAFHNGSIYSLLHVNDVNKKGNPVQLVKFNVGKK